MLNLSKISRVAVVGGGTAGWFAALTLRSMFGKSTEITLLESPNVPVVGVGEGGLLNLVQALQSLQISPEEFARETNAHLKLGFVYEGWRDGGEHDRFYHMFPRMEIEEIRSTSYGFFPLVSALANYGIELHRALPGFSVIERQGSQEEALAMLANPANGIASSYHFDSQRVCEYLRDVGLARGIIHHRAQVDDVTLNEHGHVTALNTGTGQIPVDFVIDASGFARRLIGKTLQTRWESFSASLLVDRAIPFLMPHPKPEPYLVSRALAMSAGWMWQIPVSGRVGAGYVFSSRHIDEDAALREITQRLGFEIDPARTLRFEPGHYREVWRGNVMAIGLASGFVEPLEATSIGQMLEQLRNFRRVVLESGGIVSSEAITAFNDSNTQYWAGIRDFLRMHYDCPRRDTPFWRDVAELPLPPSYRALKECMQERLPRPIDIERYYPGGWSPMFHSLSWAMIAMPLGLVSRDGALNELASLPQHKQAEVMNYLRRRWPDALPSSAAK